MEKLLPLNQISESTEITVNSAANLTSVIIPIGLHPEDIDSLQTMIGSFLLNDCEITKNCIEDFNKERAKINKNRGFN